MGNTGSQEEDPEARKESSKQNLSALKDIFL